MKYKWLNKKNNNKIIIFFNGWGMDEVIVSNLECGEFDVVILYDYNNLDIDLDIHEYKEKHIIAWSMGVMIGTLFEFKNVKTKTALCGTPKPIDNDYGIPDRIYNLTIKRFSEKSVSKFMERMFISKPNMMSFSNRDLENMKTELIKMLSYKSNENYQYTKAIIPDKDLIIPTKNQKNYWEKTDTNIVEIKSGHSPFENYKCWSDIIVGI